MAEEYKYYSTQRPISIGTYSRNNNISIENYDEKKFVNEIGREAYGELIYNAPLNKKQMEDYELVESDDQKQFVEEISALQENVNQLQIDIEKTNDVSEKKSINEMIDDMKAIISDMKNNRFNEIGKNEISFYVNESMEFPSMGAKYENIPTVEEAIKIYKQLVNDKPNMGSGIGVIIKDEIESLDGSTGEYSLFANGNVDTLEYYPAYVKDNELVKKAIDVLKSEFNNNEKVNEEIIHREEEEPLKENNAENKGKAKALSVKEETLEKLKNGIKETLDSDKFANWCQKQGKLYMNNYSFRNAMLTYIQKTDASYVMGYEAWKNFGRQVNKGAKGIKVLAPTLVNESTKGGLLSAIKKLCIAQIKKDPSLEYATFKLGQTKMSFNMYKNGLFDVKINDDVKMAHITSDELRKFLDKYVIGKIPAYYNAITVFDVKDTNPNAEFLWVKDGFKKEELVTDDNGKAITNRKGQFKIYNSDERRAKFDVNIDMTIKEADGKKMSILYDVLKEISKNKNIPVTENNKYDDEHLNKGALGYYRRPTEEYPKGNIVISEELSITNKVSVLFHEMAHSQMHRDLELLKEQMSKMNNEEVKITRSLKEMQAEAVAYMTASNFGIETEHKSFEYIANWSKGRELKELEQSLDLIYKQSKELMKDIENELDNKGLNLQFESKDKNKIDMFKDEDIKEFKSFILNQGRTVEGNLSNAIDDLDIVKNDTEKDIIKEQVLILKQIDDKLKELDNNVNEYENLNSGTKEVELANVIKSQIKQIELLQRKVYNLSDERVKVSMENREAEKVDMKSLYSSNPLKAVEKLADSYEALKGLDDIQKKFIASSKFISKEYGKFIGVDNEKFVNLATNHLKNFEEVMSKNKTVIEISSCEQWGNKPIFKQGSLLHPKLANKIFQEAEKQIQGFKALAEKENDYYPYTKCNFSVYSITDNNKLSVLKTRIDIGDNQQKNLSNHMEQICKKGKEKEEILNNFIKSTRERTKINMIEPSEIKEVAEVEKNNNSFHVSMDKWKAQMNENSKVREIDNYNNESKSFKSSKEREKE